MKDYTIRYAYRHNNSVDERYIAYSNNIPPMIEREDEKGELAERNLLQSCVIAKPSYEEAEKELKEVVKIMMDIPKDKKANV